MTWLIWLLAGISVGIIIGVLIDRDTVYRVAKIKNKRTSGNNSVVIPVEVKRRDRRRERRQDKKDARKGR